MLEAALAEYRPGHALPRALYVEEAVHAWELQAIWRASWLFAGPAAAVARAGEYFTVELGDDSVIVVRDQHGALHALHNTCRHRGMKLCADSAGTTSRWVCPYHQWSYALDGALLGCGGMEDQLDRGDYGLHRAGVEEVGGLLYVWLGAEPPPFDADARGALAGGSPTGSTIWCARTGS